MAKFDNYKTTYLQSLYTREPLNGPKSTWFRRRSLKVSPAEDALA